MPFEVTLNKASRISISLKGLTSIYTSLAFIKR